MIRVTSRSIAPGIASRTSPKDLSTDFHPSISYTYEVGGQQYQGHRITWSPADSEYKSTVKAKAQLAKYPVGKPVTVYYNPEAPGEAVLSRGQGSGSWVSELGRSARTYTLFWSFAERLWSKRMPTRMKKWFPRRW